MITRFGSDSCLLLIDFQVGVNVLQHWGGAMVAVITQMQKIKCATF